MYCDNLNIYIAAVLIMISVANPSFIVIKRVFWKNLSRFSYPLWSLLLFHYSIKEEDQSDACCGEGLHPPLQHI